MPTEEIVPHTFHKLAPFNRKAEWKTGAPEYELMVESLGKAGRKDEEATNYSVEAIQHQENPDIYARVHWKTVQKDLGGGKKSRAEREPTAFSIHDIKANTVIVWHVEDPSLKIAKLDLKTDRLIDTQRPTDPARIKSFNNLIRSAIDLHPEKEKLLKLYYKMIGN